MMNLMKLCSEVIQFVDVEVSGDGDWIRDDGTVV